MPACKMFALALSSVACAAAGILTSFVHGPPVLRTSLSVACQSSISSFVACNPVGLRASTGVKPDAAGISMMASRRNLKKEKRARNRAYVLQFDSNKPRPPRIGGRGGAVSRSDAEEKDDQWLAQIYGQHSIYRRDTPDGMAVLQAKKKIVEASNDTGVAQHTGEIQKDEPEKAQEEDTTSAPVFA